MFYNGGYTCAQKYISLEECLEYIFTRIILFGIFGYEKKELWKLMRKQCSYYIA